jgi:hypothetical protein
MYGFLILLSPINLGSNEGFSYSGHHKPIKDPDLADGKEGQWLHEIMTRV